MSFSFEAVGVYFLKRVLVRRIAGLLCAQLSACGTLLAVADGVGTVAVSGVKKVINTVDAITPDIVNKEDL